VLISDNSATRVSLDPAERNRGVYFAVVHGSSKFDMDFRSICIDGVYDNYAMVLKIIWNEPNKQVTIRSSASRQKRFDVVSRVNDCFHCPKGRGLRSFVLNYAATRV
jgi:hypothetical protein